MKPVVFKQDSWHYWLTEFGGWCPRNTDICRYTRAVLRGLLLFLLSAFLVVAIAALTGAWFGWAVASITHSFVPPEGLALVFCVALGVVAGTAALLGTLYVLVEKVSPALADVVYDSFASEAYRSFKDKVCFRVEVR